MRRAAIVAGVLLALCGAAPDARAEKFTSAEFLKWSLESQMAYFQNSVTMVGIVATQIDKAKARCIDDWHGNQNKNGYPALADAVRKYPDYHPQAIILWLLQHECGKLGPDK